MDKNKIQHLIEDALSYLKIARYKMFFTTMNELLEQLNQFNPSATSIFQRDLILLENRYNNLENDSFKGIIKYSTKESVRAVITDACLQMIEFIKREIEKNYQKVKEPNHNKISNADWITFELKINEKYSKENAEALAFELKKQIEDYLETNLEYRYVRKGSIVIQFKIKKDLELIKKVKSIENLQIIKNLEYIKFSDQLINEYLEHINYYKYYENTGNDKYFRANVGAIIINPQRQVLAFERVDFQNSWQFPQGGLDEGESPRNGVEREIFEETGIISDKDLKYINEYKDWVVYELPKEMRNEWLGRGQVQKWFLYEIKDEDINIDLSKGNEFSNWQWMEMEDLVEMVIPFRQPIYKKLSNWLVELYG